MGETAGTGDRRDTCRPTSGEAPFGLDEVFFSRTDGRGVIRSSNQIFWRVAGYEWRELLGAPHKVVRHPDMPRGVFWLLWDTIRRGEPMGAFVKNNAKDGLHYWVFAIMVPCGDGYLSARIKPSSRLFGTLRETNARLRRHEDEVGWTPEQSAQSLLDQIKAMGFRDYFHFSSYALSEELITRDTGNGWAEDRTIRRFRQMLEIAETLKAETTAMIRDFELSGIIPHNMRVIASRLEPNGGPISTLSTNYGAMSREMSRWFESNVVGENSDFATIERSVADCILRECTARLLNDCADQLEAERAKLGEINLDADRDRLLALAADYRARSAAHQRRVAGETRRIGLACETMGRFMLGLSTTRIMCKIEGARQQADRESLTEVIAKLNGFQQCIRTNLNRIEEMSGTIQALAS